MTCTKFNPPMNHVITDTVPMDPGPFAILLIGLLSFRSSTSLNLLADNLDGYQEQEGSILAEELSEGCPLHRGRF